MITDENGTGLATMQDFWAWAYSNLTSNTQRGTYAEFLVSIGKCTGKLCSSYV